MRQRTRLGGEHHGGLGLCSFRFATARMDTVVAKLVDRQFVGGDHQRDRAACR